MNFARILNNVAVDVSTDPTNSFHPSLAADFIEVPDDVVVGSKRDAEGVWTPPTPPTPPEPPAPEPAVPPIVGPIAFKLLFTAQERIAIKTSEDPIVLDFFSIAEDPRTTEVNLALSSTQEALTYLTTVGILAEGRKEQILTGVLL